MTRSIALKYLRVLRVLLVCAALPMSNTLHAQPHTDAEPDISTIVRPQDQLNPEEERVANPCWRDRVLEKMRDEFQRMAGLALCVQRTRSQYVSNAWKMGLDKYGVKLEADAHARKTTEMEIWLRRLQGKYRIEGKYWNSVTNLHLNNAGGSSPLNGTANCFGVGAGPGVACLISTKKWRAPAQFRKDPYLDSALQGAMQRGLLLLFGIDPGAAQVRVTLLDFRAVGMSGLLDDGTVVFGGRPNIDSVIGNMIGNALITYTWTTTVVTAKPDGDLQMKFLVSPIGAGTILFDLQLHRELAAGAK